MGRGFTVAGKQEKPGVGSCRASCETHESRQLPTCLTFEVRQKSQMNTRTTTRGSCLCGSVRFEAVLPPVRFQYCHCVSCRKTTSSAHAANLFFLPEKFRWICGEELIQRFSDQHTNLGYTRWFCKKCGSCLPRFNRSKEYLVVPAGLLDDDPLAKPERSIFWDDHASWYSSVDAIPKFAEGPGSLIRENEK